MANWQQAVEKEGLRIVLGSLLFYTGLCWPVSANALQASPPAEGQTRSTSAVADTQGPDASGPTGAQGAPRVSCSSSLSSARADQVLSITTKVDNVERAPQLYSYSSSQGMISGDGESGTLDLATARPGNVRIVCQIETVDGSIISGTTNLQVLPSTDEDIDRGGDDQVTPSCSAEPDRVRAGEPVILKIKDVDGGGVSWTASGGILDQGDDYAIVDTANLAPGRATSLATVKRLGVIIGRCQVQFSIDPNAPAHEWPILNIVSIALPADRRENNGFGLNTYVLYRIRPSSEQDAKRFRSILSAVAEHPDVSSLGHPGLEVSEIPVATTVHEQTSKRELAPIFVPVDSPPSGPLMTAWLFDHYDTARAAQLLSHLNCTKTDASANCKKQIGGDGPYLISTTVRLTGEPEAVLIQNLADTSPEMGRLWVSSYMDMVRKQKNWTAFTLQQASLSFAATLDRLGLQLQSTRGSVTAAFSFFNLKK